MTQPKREGDAETRPFIEAAIGEHQRQVMGDMQEVTAACMEEVKQVLKKHGCVLVPRAFLSPQGMEFLIETHMLPKGEGFATPEPVPLAAQLKEEQNARKVRQMSKKSKVQSGRKRKKR